VVTSVVCPTPENPKNGKATYTTLAYNSVVSYECRYGYTLMGESSSRCGADRKWSGLLPTCKGELAHGIQILSAADLTGFCHLCWRPLFKICIGIRTQGVFPKPSLSQKSQVKIFI